MATKLTDGNIKTVISDIPKKGFRTKFWREYRAGACKGSGVAASLDKLEKLGLPASGDPSKVPFENLSEVHMEYASLAGAFYRAGTKCGKFQKQSKDLCTAYKKQIEKYEKVSKSLLDGGGQKLAIQKMAEEDKKKEQERKTLDECTMITTTCTRVTKECAEQIRTCAEAQKVAEAAHKAWEQNRGKEGSMGEHDSRALKQIPAIATKYKLQEFGKAMKGNIADYGRIEKLVKGLEPSDGTKTEVMASMKAFEDYRKALKGAENAREAALTTLTEFKRAVAKASDERPEGV